VGPGDWGLLIERTAAGEERALAALYDGTAAQVNGLALRILGDAGAAEEVTLDVYLQVWRQAVRYDPSRGRPLAWLLMLARSRAIDRLRAGATERAQASPFAEALPLPSAAALPEERSAAGERGRIVREAVARLPDDQRQAIELAYFVGLSQSEIAETLDTPLGTVKTRIRLAMVRLRETLGATGRDLL
jgi:RNA polymerase sigma-70 factor (ECF subfamily)